MKRKLIENYTIENKEKLYRIDFSYTKNKKDELNIVQEARWKEIKSANTIKNPQYIKTWYYKILTRTAIDYIRKNSKYIPLDTEYSAETVGKYDDYEDIDLKRALDLLTYDQRVIITLRFFEDMKIKDIAEITGENINTIKTRLYKALEVLRINIEEA